MWSFVVICVVMVLAFIGSELALAHEKKPNDTEQKPNSPESGSNDETKMVD